MGQFVILNFGNTESRLINDFYHAERNIIFWSFSVSKLSSSHQVLKPIPFDQNFEKKISVQKQFIIAVYSASINLKKFSFELRMN